MMSFMKIGIFISDKPHMNLHGLFSRQRKPTPCEVETRRRIRIAIAAYAYEITANNTMTDQEYDSESLILQKNLHIDTTRPHLDKWFRENFEPDTGMWIHNHPELDKLASYYYRYIEPKLKLGQPVFPAWKE